MITTNAAAVEEPSTFQGTKPVNEVDEVDENIETIRQVISNS